MTTELASTQVAEYLEATCALIESELAALGTDSSWTSAWDQVAVAKERNDCARLGQSVWMEFMGVRSDGIKLVRSFKPADLAKGIEHPQVGQLTIRDLLHEWIHHDRNHTRQLLQIAQERAWPHMGNSQKFKGE